MSLKFFRSLLAMTIVMLMASFQANLTQATETSTVDLENLYKKKEWTTLLAQLSKVDSVLKDDRWSQMVFEAADQSTQSAERLDVPQLAFTRLFDYMTRFPELGKTKWFVPRLRKATLAVSRQCVKNKTAVESCLKRLKSVAQRYPNDPLLQFESAALIRQEEGVHSAMSFYWKAFEIWKNELSRTQLNERCSDGDLKITVTSSLGLPSKLPENAEPIQNALSIAFGPCFSEWQDTLSELFAKDRVYFQQNTCAQMKKRGLLAGSQVKHCPKK